MTEVMDVLEDFPTPKMEVTEVCDVKLEKDDKEGIVSANGLLPSRCYCDKDRVSGDVELQCYQCACFYHYECVKGCYIGSMSIPFMTNYVFSCKRCLPVDSETFTRKTASFTQMCITAVANLTHQHKDRPVNPQMFSKDREIIPFIDKHWEILTTMPRRVKLSWHNTVVKAMIKETEIFTCNEETPGDQMFGFINNDLTVIGPLFESTKSINLAVKQDAKIGPVLPDVLGKTRNYKRRLPPDPNSMYGIKQKRGDSLLSTRQAITCYPAEYPLNKDGYRYILAEMDMHSPHHQAFDESQETAGKPIPGCLYRMYVENDVLLALHDRAPQLKLTDDRLTVTGEKGYSMVRSTHAVSSGSWYYEVRIDDLPDNTATRLGWSQPLGNLQAPCGYDKFSYSWRSKKGTIFHQSRGKHMSDGYGKGDVLGFYIYLPEPYDPSKLLPVTCKYMPLVKFKSHLYYEDKDEVAETEKLLAPCPGSKMRMYKNGKLHGTAYTDIYEGIYHPTISIYKCATVTINFGPVFKYPPKDVKYKPISACVTQAIVEQSLSDILYHIENEGKPLDC